MSTDAEQVDSTMSSQKHIIVGMSGGVDSSVAAALLKQQGHRVIGVGLKLAELSSEESERPCCGDAAMDDARRVAHSIGIPFYALNCVEVFEERVIDYFCRSYLSGRTPNPCVECNRAVKFMRLLDLAEELGADCVATGHYAAVRADESTGRHLLTKGADARKDQSYFLYGLSEQQLWRIVFPLAEMTKEQTRGLARSFGLKVSDKPASQDVCFLPGGDYRRFLARRCPDALQPGPIVDTQGRVLGRHNGIASFTVGQRKGLGVAAGVPLYVVALDAAARSVVVGTRQEAAKDRIWVAQTNWIAADAPPGAMRVSVKVRYRQPEVPAVVTYRGNGRAEVVFSRPQLGVAPGQSAVFYRGDFVVGGGIIQ